MEIAPNRYACQWCSRHFDRRHRTGRKPVYCGRPCRQRAYEARRRSALVAGYPKPTIAPFRRAPPSYEAGRNNRITHALRPDGFPAPNGARPSLCGAWAHPIRPPFSLAVRYDARPCKTCLSVGRRHPPTRAVDHDRDLALVTALAGRLRPDLACLPPPAKDLVAYCWPAG